MEERFDLLLYYVHDSVNPIKNKKHPEFLSNNCKHCFLCQVFDLLELIIELDFIVFAYDTTVIFSQAFTLFCYIYLASQIHTPTVTIWRKATKAVKYI